MMAYFTACNMSVHTKRPVAPSELLKPLRQAAKQQDKKQDEEYLREQFKDVLK